MLSEQEIAAIQAELKDAEEPCAITVEALKIVQASRGFVSDESITDIAAVLGMTADELDSIATFYPFIFRRAVGRHVVLACDGVVCWITGAENVFTYLQQRL